MTKPLDAAALPLFPPPLAGRNPMPAAEFAAQIRHNVLAAFSERAFEEEVLSRRLFGRQQLTLNRPAAIRHVLIDNADNYSRTAATVRLLYPIVGRGLFLGGRGLAGAAPHCRALLRATHLADAGEPGWCRRR